MNFKELDTSLNPLVAPRELQGDREGVRFNAALDIIRTRKQEVAAIYGTAKAAGSDPKKWLPFHSYTEFDLGPAIVTDVFHAAMEGESGFAGLEQRDLPILLASHALFYENFGDLYHVEPSFAEDRLKNTPVFDQQDINLVRPSINARYVKVDNGSEIAMRSIPPTEPFAVQQLIARDASLGINAHRLGIPAYMLLGVERLIKDGELRTRDGELPHTLEDVMGEGATYKPDVLKNYLKSIDSFFFSGKTDYMTLPTTPQALPYLSANVDYFKTKWAHLIAPDSTINLASMVRESLEFSHGLRNP